MCFSLTPLAAAFHPSRACSSEEPGGCAIRGRGRGEAGAPGGAQGP
jgi:hypothetical protein